ncbi:MAG: hypothetical protein AB8G05_06455 [Oligoflexales bacterium]
MTALEAELVANQGTESVQGSAHELIKAELWNDEFSFAADLVEWDV